MCGIVGKYNLDGSPVNPDLITAMSNELIHRGPDDGGVHVEGHVGLGHRRLSIIDLSPLGHQPMATADEKLWIVFNGEIYNFREKRKELEAKGYELRSQSDTEVILYLYREYGKRCLDHLRGMFAFAIWDKEKDLLFLARDRIGKKPLFYACDGKTFLFASEIKSILLDPCVEKRIHWEAFADYFRYLYVPDPKTIYRNIYKLEPGCGLVCAREGMKKERYWEVSFANPPGKGEDAIGADLLKVLGESVKLRMISDVPLGAFLSGGIDSSAVVALMAMQQQGPVTTCSIGFDSRDHDEIRYARAIAEKFHTDHHEFTVKQNVEEVLEDLAYHFDEPFADSSAVPTYYVSRIARRKVTVALAGDGGDENFAGYEKYAYDRVENRLRKALPSALRTTALPPLARMLGRGDHPFFQKGATLLRTLGFDAGYGFYLTNTELNTPLWDELINEDTARGIGGYDPSWVTRSRYEEADTDDHLSKILYTDLKTYLPGDILVKVDRMSMAHSLEVRAPLLDHHVVELAASIPAGLKYRQGEKKYIFKRALADTLPRDILYRKKMGFSVPLAQWLRGEIKEPARRLLMSEDARVNAYFNRGALKGIWEAHQTGARNFATVLWALLMFELWHRRYMS